MSLFDKLKLQELGQALRELPFSKHRADRKQIAHFCEHDGICIHFTPARTSWHALAPCALKPWWIFLQPIRKSAADMAQQKQKQTDTNAEKITTKNVDSEVTENA